MLMESVATALNIRVKPGGMPIGELRLGDLVECDDPNSEWVIVEAKSGRNAGTAGVVRRKWLIQFFETTPVFDNVTRADAGRIVFETTSELDAVRYRLGTRYDTLAEVKKQGFIDCSGWVALLGGMVLKHYGRIVPKNCLTSHSDKQIIRLGAHTMKIVSGRFLQPQHFLPGVILGIDYSEYSWDRGRALDVDHIGIIGDSPNGPIFSQSSGSGSGVNSVPMQKWIDSHADLIAGGRVHAVDFLAVPK